MAGTARQIDLDGLPKRIVLSRKGSDAAWGGRPSLRVGEELISLPIPESAARVKAAEETGVGVRYGELPRHARVGALHEHLRRIDAERYVHLDPDLRPELRPGKPRRGRRERMFGQEGAAARHLQNQEISAGDLFLFFGWFARLKNAKAHGSEWGRMSIASGAGCRSRRAIR